MPSPHKTQASNPAEMEMSSRKKTAAPKGIPCQGRRRQGNAGHQAQHESQTEILKACLPVIEWGLSVWLSFETASV